MIQSTPQIIIESRTGNIILEPMRMARLEAFKDAVEPIIDKVFLVLENEEGGEGEQNAKQNIAIMLLKQGSASGNPTGSMRNLYIQVAD